MSNVDPPNSPAALARLLGRMEPRRLARFVAALWRAAGREASAEGSIVTVDGTPGEVARYAVEQPEAPDSVDGAIVPEGAPPAWVTPEEHELVDAEALYRRAVYGVNARDRRRVFETHLGCPPPDPPEPTRVEPDRNADRSGASEDTSVEDADIDGGTTRDRGGDGVVYRLPVTPLQLGVLVVATALVIAGTAAGTFLLVRGPTPAGAAVESPPEADGSQRETGPSGMPRGAGSAGGLTPAAGVAGTGVNATRYFGLRPSCERPPGLVVRIQVGALRYNDRDHPQGLLTVWAFLTLNTRQAIGSFDSFVEEITTDDRFRGLLRSRSAEYGSIRVRNGTAIQRVAVTTRSGREVTYQWVLLKRNRSTLSGCWLTTDIARVFTAGNATETG